MMGLLTHHRPETGVRFHGRTDSVNPVYHHITVTVSLDSDEVHRDMALILLTNTYYSFINWLQTSPAASLWKCLLFWDPFYWHSLTMPLILISNIIYHFIWDLISHPCHNFHDGWKISFRNRDLYSCTSQQSCEIMGWYLNHPVKPIGTNLTQMCRLTQITRSKSLPFVVTTDFIIRQPALELNFGKTSE